VPILTEIALRTRRIRLLSGILSIWGRSPATLAMTAATLQDISGGRFVLGLGASTRALAEGFHNVPFVHVSDRLRDTVCTVRALLAGGAPQVAGARGIRLGIGPTLDVPIWLAALGERNMQVVADVADGWLPLFIDRARLQARRLESVTVAAWYVAGMGGVYGRALSKNGYAVKLRWCGSGWNAGMKRWLS
jgi:alkanesulfonate monooxygenase SsuD/methylene tetrahydromethanopterin reductase-like flavin-dependent oxidoreductase (luciferase family)